MEHPAPKQIDDLWLVLPHLGPGGAQKVALLAAGFFGQGLARAPGDRTSSGTLGVGATGSALLAITTLAMVCASD